MRPRRHTIDSPHPLLPLASPTPVRTLTVLVVDEGSPLFPPTATRLQLRLPDEAPSSLPSWGAVAGALVLQGPGAWAASTRCVVVAMYAPGARFLANLDEWEAARKTPLESITRLTILRAEQGLPVPAIPGAAEAYAHLAQVLATTRPTQELPLQLPLLASTHLGPFTHRDLLHIRSADATPLPPSAGVRPGLPTWTLPLFPMFLPLHERRGIVLPALKLSHAAAGGQAYPISIPHAPVSTHSVHPVVGRKGSRDASGAASSSSGEPSGVTSASLKETSTLHPLAQSMRTKATPLADKTSWGNWFVWSP